MGNRVVITGMGTVNPVGNTVDEFWDGLVSGKSGIGPLTKFDPTEFATKIAGEVKNFDPTQYIEARAARKMDPFSHYALAASIQAMDQAGLDAECDDPHRRGVILGCGIGGFETLEEAYRRLFDGGPRKIMPTAIPKLIGNIGPGNIALHFNMQGPTLLTVTACASGADAIGNAFHWIQRGVADVLIAGGAEACITQLGIGGFNVLHALSTGYNDRPTEASRPFDSGRDGFVLGEGAGIVVMEDLEHAKKRGATIYAELCGYGIANDANHLTAPHPEGRGATQAMTMALADARTDPAEIDYINAHGTSTQLNDAMETLAVKKVFGGEAYNTPISSTKSMTGHCIGATGAIEMIAAVLAINTGQIPPTINLTDPDPKCDLDYVPNESRVENVNAALSNSFGFGGHNSSLVLRKFSG